MTEKRGGSIITGRMLLGAVIALVGLILILGELGAIDPGGVWRFWPLLLIGYGALKLFASTFPGQRVWGAIVLLFGILFMLAEWTTIDISWPLIFALGVFAVGMRVLWRGVSARKGPSKSSDAWIREWAVFGGGERRITSSDFRGGDLNAAFGGLDIDLRDCTIEGEEAVIEVLVMFGGIDIFVPRDWNVVLQPVALFGGCSDARKPMEVKIPATGAKRLVIRGTVLFGGFEVKA